MAAPFTSETAPRSMTKWRATRLTPREMLFVDIYCSGKYEAGYLAAKEAGFKYPKRDFNKMMRKPIVKEAIAKAFESAIAKTGITREAIVRRVAEKFYEPSATAGDVARLGKLLAEMTQGALVPVSVNHTGLDLEAFMATAAQAAVSVHPAIKPEPIEVKQIDQSMLDMGVPPPVNTH